MSRRRRAGVVVGETFHARPTSGFTRARFRFYRGERRLRSRWGQRKFRSPEGCNRNPETRQKLGGAGRWYRAAVVMAQEADSWDVGPGSIPGRDTSFDVPESSCLLSGPWLQLESRYKGPQSESQTQESKTQNFELSPGDSQTSRQTSSSRLTLQVNTEPRGLRLPCMTTIRSLHRNPCLYQTSIPTLTTSPTTSTSHLEELLRFRGKVEW